MQFYAIAKGILENRGRPIVPFAVLLEEEHGYRGDGARVYDPATGARIGSDKTRYTEEYEQIRKRLCIWQFRLEDITNGDWQVQAFVDGIWPRADNKFKPYVENFPERAIGGWPGDKLHDLRTGYEHPSDYDRFLGDSRWADCFDVINEKVSADVLKKYYKVVLLGGEVRTDNGLWEKAKEFLTNGGTVVASIDQLTDDALAECGIAVKGAKKSVKLTKTGENVELYDTTIIGENTRVVESEVLIDSQNPLLLEASIGNGKIYIFTFSYAMNIATHRFSTLFTHLIDRLYLETVGVTKGGPGAEMIVSERGNETLVTLLNNTGETWRGWIQCERKGRGEITAVRDTIADENISDKHVQYTETAVRVSVEFPAHGYKVLTFGKPSDYVDRAEAFYKDPFADAAAVDKVHQMQKQGALEKNGSVEDLKNYRKTHPVKKR
jgi:hypothetical protein